MRVSKIKEATVKLTKEIWFNFKEEKHWVVEMTKRPVEYDIRWDYFPRKFVYREYAEVLIREIRKKGGDAALYKDVTRL